MDNGNGRRRTIALRDLTLREGLDTPGVNFSGSQALRITTMLAAAGIREAEIVAPARVADGLGIARRLRERGVRIKTSGLVYAAGRDRTREIAAVQSHLDRFDLLMPLSPKRDPRKPRAKIATLLEALALVEPPLAAVGVGFPHATQVDPSFLMEISTAAVDAGATRVTIYDTNGSADPFAIKSLIARLTRRIAAPVYFHGHNDLGLATANSLAAALGGAKGLDVTVNGLGDRAGNASLEQVAVGLIARGWRVGADPGRLRELSQLVATASGVSVSKLAPVVGEFVFAHRSPAHLPMPAEFEAFAPKLIGARRRLERRGSAR